jgi:RNA polymerase sigma-32 factor
MKRPTTESEGQPRRYFREIRKFPLLDPERELALAIRCRDESDSAAAHALINSHLRLVAKIAVGYRGYGLSIDDLISEGNVGLTQAVERFDPDRGARLATYATWWIRAAILEYVMRSWSVVKISSTLAQKKLFFNLARLKSEMGVTEGNDLLPETVRAIATALGVTEEEVVTMNRRLSGRDCSLNKPLTENGETDLQSTFVDATDDPMSLLADRQELAHRRQLLTDALSILSDRERKILIERRLRDDPPTLSEVSLRYKISRERVRQIEEHAFQKVQKAIMSPTPKESGVDAARRRDRRPRESSITADLTIPNSVDEAAQTPSGVTGAAESSHTQVKFNRPMQTHRPSPNSDRLRRSQPRHARHRQNSQAA